MSLLTLLLTEQRQLGGSEATENWPVLDDVMRVWQLIISSVISVLFRLLIRKILS